MMLTYRLPGIELYRRVSREEVVLRHGPDVLQLVLDYRLLLRRREEVVFSEAVCEEAVRLGEDELSQQSSVVLLPHLQFFGHLQHLRRGGAHMDGDALKPKRNYFQNGGPP